MSWHMVHFSDLQRLTTPAQFFAFSEAYLESAESLCGNLCAKDAGMTYAHGAVILSLTFHSCELFLKAAILQKVPTEQFSGNTGHNLEHLSKRYANLFPGKAWALDLPFRRHPADLDGLDPRIAEELKTFVREREKAVPEDQLHRYPTNIQGQPWDVLLGFEPNSFRLESARIKCEFKRLKNELQHG